LKIVNQNIIFHQLFVDFVNTDCLVISINCYKRFVWFVKIVLIKDIIYYWRKNNHP